MSEAVLNDELKSTIQTAYRAWLDARGFRPRRGQREMIAAIARTLTGDAPRIVAVEAGTGTGKTAAYCLAAIPTGAALDKTVVISTATVALQEQVVLRDLPDLASRSGLTFSFTLAKGRGRYVCLKRLDDRLRYADPAEVPLFEDTGEEGAALYEDMLNAFASKTWNGDRDEWSEEVDPRLWGAVTTDHRGCSNNRCGFFRQCPFFKARGSLDAADVIVANHDLVLADLSLGGGVVLPPPEDCIYVLDEAHHLPEKTQQHFSASTRVLATGQWVDNVARVVGSLTQRFGRPDELVSLATRASEHGAAFAEAMMRMADDLQGFSFEPRGEALATHRFRLGQVPAELAEQAQLALEPLALLAGAISAVHELLQKAVAGELPWENGFEAEDWLPAVGQLETRALATMALLEDFGRGAGEFTEEGSPQGLKARWVNETAGDLEMVSAPLQPGRLLQEALWSSCYAAVCTSATLTALGTFDRFLEQVGLETVNAVRIPSPFDFQRLAKLTVPSMRSDPRDFAAHSEEVAALLPELLAEDPGALVLFTSWRQMHEVIGQLPEDLLEKLQVQGEASKQALLSRHRSAVDEGRQSVLVGLASFAEGVDLPDDYCRHVVIVKLPFAVPDDPVDQAMAEWVEARGRNAFFEIAVPDAALKLVQACGRLVRHEGDFGRITLLDRRIVTQRYGRALLDSLPPYRRELNPS